jgi:hypothetical protein
MQPFVYKNIFNFIRKVYTQLYQSIVIIMWLEFQLLLKLLLGY